MLMKISCRLITLVNEPVDAVFATGECTYKGMSFSTLSLHHNPLDDGKRVEKSIYRCIPLL
jgi:hypothetical protein